MNFSLIDTIVVLIYILIVFYIGFFASKEKSSQKKQDYEGFLLAGRKLTLPIFVATLVATWYGNILGIGEFVYTNGILAWICFCLPYYISAAIYAIFVAKKIRISNVRTIPEQITNKFGDKAGYISSIIILIITIPAAYILMLGIIVQLFTGWQLWICIVVGTSVSLVYLFNGGFKADVLTNSVQFIFMYIGFGALLFFCITKLGSFELMLSKLPHSHLYPPENSIQLIIVWFIISLQTFVDPSFHQRCAAAKSPNIARNGIIVSILFWMLFDFLTITTGLYARAFFTIDNPVMAFTVLGNSVLPYFWKGVFVVALLATVMSTLDSYAFISAATIGNDILSPIINSKKLIISNRTLIKIGLGITAIIGMIMAILIPSAVQLIYKTASIAVPGLLVPVIFSYSVKNLIKPTKIIFIMFISVCISLAWYIGQIFASNYHGYFNLFLNIEPMIPGIVISFLLALIFYLNNLSSGTNKNLFAVNNKINDK